MFNGKFLNRINSRLQTLALHHGQRCIVFILISAATSLLFFSYALLHLLTADYGLVVINLSLLSLILGNLTLLQRHGDFPFAVNIFLTIVFGHNNLALLHNHFANVGLYWTALFPILTFMLKGQRQALGWSALMAGSLAFYIIASKYELLHTAYSLDSLYSMLINLVLISLSVSIYMRLNARHIEHLHNDEQLRYLATHDSLTKLLNRSTFLQQLEQHLSSTYENDHQFALMFLDLDHFKQINDNYGHGVGDQVLAMAAKRVKHSVRATDLVCRYGGDEFLILLHELQPKDAKAIVDKLEQQFHSPFYIDNEEIYLGISVGISFCPHDNQGLAELIEHADKSMYSHKMRSRKVREA